MGDVLDDVDGVGLPHWHGDLDVLLYWNVHLLDDLVRPVYRNRDLPDDLNWDLLDNLIRHWPLDFDVLSLVYWVWDLLDNVDWDWVGLRHWHSHLFANGNRIRLRDSHLNVADDFNGHAADNVLYHGLQFVSCG